MTIAVLIPATDRFGSIMLALRQSVASHWKAPGMGSALANLICGRLGRLEIEVLALIARIVAGTLRSYEARTCRDGPVARSQQAARPSGPALPRRLGWLCRLVPYQAAGYGSQFRYLFEQPEMAALIAANPRLARLLRPLCGMLAVEGLPWLKPRPLKMAKVPRAAPTPSAVADPISKWRDYPGTISGGVWLRSQDAKMTPGERQAQRICMTVMGWPLACRSGACGSSIRRKGVGLPVLFRIGNVLTATSTAIEPG